MKYSALSAFVTVTGTALLALFAIPLFWFLLILTPIIAPFATLFLIPFMASVTLSRIYTWSQKVALRSPSPPRTYILERPFRSIEKQEVLTLLRDSGTGTWIQRS